MLSGVPLNPIYERTFSIFNATLFGVTATPRTDFIPDTGDYSAEIREFNEQLAAERIEDTATADQPLPPSPSAPSSPPEPHVSVSVTSNVSHVTTAVNVVTSKIALAPADEEVNVPPPATKTAKTTARKKRGSAANANPPEDDAELVAPAPKKNPGRKAKATSVEPTTKSTRSRG